MIVVTTPTGQIGRHLLDLLLDARDTAGPVRVIARDPARLPARARDHVEVVRGSHADPGVLKEACAGADRVFWLVPPTRTAESAEGLFDTFTRPLCEVIEQGGVERVVAVSTLGRGIARDAGLISASLAMDDRIAATGVHYRALCPPFLMENLLDQAGTVRDLGAFFLTVAGDRVLRTCAVRDIAAAAARLLLDDGWTGRADVPLVGPDELTPEGMARVMAEVLDRPVGYRRSTVEEYRATIVGSGASEGWARGAADMVRALDEQGFYGAGAPSTPEWAPTGFRQWCEEVLLPAVRD
ncbi:NmrA family transcriptional regulator [Streptomyces fumigatiscleroticus]|nr:NmrA family transcriptional regulator [Streptomyces fumigatiscleroticus]